MTSTHPTRRVERPAPSEMTAIAEAPGSDRSAAGSADRSGADGSPAYPAFSVLALVAVGLAVSAIALLAEADLLHVTDLVRLFLAVAFSGAGLALARRPGTRTLGLVVLAGVSMAGVELLATAVLRREGSAIVAEAVESIAAALVIALAFHLLLLVPDGRLPTSGSRVMLGVGYALALGVGLLRWAQQPDPEHWPMVLLALVLGGAGLAASNRRYVAARGVSRQRMQWLGLALALCAEVAVLTGALRVLLDWPSRPMAWVAASLGLVAAALAAASSPRLVGRVDRLLSHAVSLAGLSAVVTVIYLVIVVGLGRVPTDEEQTVLVLSMVAAAASALVYVPARERLASAANRLVYGEERDPTEALDTFGARLTRALPMEELLLQLVELCKKHLALRAAEVWTGTGGTLARAASVPDRGPGVLQVGPKELPVITRARVSGRGWAEVWLPQLLVARGAGPLRLVSMAHQGELFGVLVLERAEGDDDFTEEDDRVLTEICRQVALALRNAELDSALEATLEEVQRKNVELQESRARIVATADRERRAIERNLHDGAQQHLVALAVKLRLVQRLAESDPAKALELVEEARADVLTTVDEVRALAHGIYPPLLMDKGLPDALTAAAARAVLPTSVEADGVGRYPQDVEAAVYFCCLEALQNAGKHAGDGATISVTVEQLDGELRFEVRDDGAGFDADAKGSGHGFVNMADRLGAIGGDVAVSSAAGSGTSIQGRIPVEPLPVD